MKRHRVDGVTSRIRRFLSSLRYGTLFSSRELLGFGKRAAVDMALSRMNRQGIVSRQAHGIYCKAGAGYHKFSAEEIARKKAQAFGKQIIALAQPKIRLLRREPGKVVMAFATTGASSSFKFGDVTIQFVGSAPRKVKMFDEAAGLAAREHWDLGLSACLASDDDFPRALFERLKWEQRFKLLDMFKELPAWFNDGLAWKRVRTPRPDIVKYTVPELIDNTEIRLKNAERQREKNEEIRKLQHQLWAARNRSPDKESP